jgi:thioredoxin reductase (NADPH)
MRPCFLLHRMFREDDMEDVIILGTGAAGLTAAIYTARAGLEAVGDRGIAAGRPADHHHRGGELPGLPGGRRWHVADEPYARAQAEKFGTRFAVQPGDRLRPVRAPLKLTLDDGVVLETRALIVATGASAKYVGLPNEQKLIGRGVTSCATCDGAFYKNVPVAVVGGGDTAMEEANFLTRFASKVYLIHRRDEFRASKIMAERVLANPKIEVVWNSVVVDVLDVAKNEVTGLKLKNVKTGAVSDLDVKALFVAIGHQPNTDAFVGQLDMDDKGYLKAQNTRTNQVGVFAAGDVQDSSYRQAITAAGSGCMAALEAERYLESVGH